MNLVSVRHLGSPEKPRSTAAQSLTFFQEALGNKEIGLCRALKGGQVRICFPTPEWLIKIINVPLTYG